VSEQLPAAFCLYACRNLLETMLLHEMKMHIDMMMGSTGIFKRTVELEIIWFEPYLFSYV
jgi:hypothetical protein